MNITVISFEFPPEPGGMGEYAYQVADKLSSLGHKILVITSYQKITSEDFTQFKNKQKFTIKIMKGYNGRTLFLLRKFFLFKRLILKNGTQLIIVVHPTFGLLSQIIKLLYGIPYIIVGHGSEFLTINIIRDSLIKLCYEGAAFILPNSNYTRLLLEKTKIKNKKINLLYPGADAQLFNYTKYPVKKPRGKKIILTVGALSVRKGHKQVIDALQILRKNNFDFEYWIIGKGTEKANLLEYIRDNGLSTCIKLIGYVSREELPSYYHKSDLFVLASGDIDAFQVEGFGIVLVEANLMLKPVIGSYNTGMEEIIIDGYNGLLVNPKNPADIAAKIKLILTDDKLAEQMGQNGHKRAIELFTWSKFGEELNLMITNYFENRTLE